MSDYNLTALNISAEEFLGALFEAGDTIGIRIFSDKKGSAFTGLNLEAKQGLFDAMTDTLKQHNEKDRGIFYVVNFGGQEDAQITRINAQFMENDKLSLEEQLAMIKAFPSNHRWR